MENLKNITPVEDFNWDAYENGEAVTSMSHEDLEKAYDGTLNKVNDREVVDGTVIAMNKREVVVNIGYKSDGIIPLNEFRYNPDLKIGDTVEVYIENQEDKKGQLILSHKKARATRSWDRVNAALENEEIIKGYIKCRTKGGMIVDVFGIEAFLPGSQIDVKPIRDYDVFVGKTMEFKVVKINQEFKNVVVSHKALIEAELEQQKKEIIGKLEKGQVLEGTVKNITSYGVFIDLGGVDGLIHITDLSWGRVSDPKEVVELDQKLNVVILDFDDEKKRIALGLKQLTPHPWDALDANLQVGDKVKGKVVVMADYGAFIEIAPGVEGLIHVSEMSWTQHLRSAQDFMKVGDEIEVEVIKVNDGEGNVLLSRKNVESKKLWDNLMQDEENLQDKTFDAVGKEVVKGGLIATINGIRAFIPASQLSTKYVENIGEFVGKDLKVKIIEVDKSRKRIVASHKAVMKEEAEAAKKELWNKLEVGSKVKGVVRRLTDFGAFVDIGGIDGLVHVTDVAWGRVKHPSDVLSIGQEIEVLIRDVDVEKQRVSLGYKQLQPKPWTMAAEKYPVGSIVEGKVVRIVPFGAFVALEPTIDGLIHISQVGVKRIEKVEDEINVGDVVRCKVLDVNPEAKRISLSRRDVILEENPEVAEQLAAEKAERERVAAERAAERAAAAEAAKAANEAREAERAERRRQRREENEYDLLPVERATTSLADKFAGFKFDEE